MLEVDPEVALKIQARARERGVSVDVYLRELIDQKGTESERGNGLSRRSEFACCESGRQATHSTHPFLQVMQLIAKPSTQNGVNVRL